MPKVKEGKSIFVLHFNAISFLYSNKVKRQTHNFLLPEKREKEVSEEAMKQARARYEREKARGTSLDAMEFDSEIYEHLMKTTVREKQRKL